MRTHYIDEIRGIAFLLMLVHHAHYFVDVSNNYKTHYADSSIVRQVGNISRFTFILLVGVSLYQGYKNKYSTKFNSYLKNRLKRSVVIFAHALTITLVSLLLYPKYFIRFGVLHFITLASFLGAFFVKIPNVAGLIGIILSCCLSLFKFNLGSILNLILGTKVEFAMMDYFPLLKWFPLVLGGIFLGSVLDTKLDNFMYSKALEYIGKHSLNLYTVHIILLLVLLKKY